MQASIFSEERYTTEAREKAAKAAAKVESRFSKWTVSLKYLVEQSDVDLILSQQSEFCDSIIMNEKERVSENQRLLLECEQLCVKAKRINAIERQKRLQRITKKVHKTAHALIMSRIKEADILRLAPSANYFADLAAFAYGPTLNFNKLSSLSVVDQPLAGNIIELVNNAKFCKKMGKSLAKNKDVKTAIGFIGIENCRMIYPVLMSKALLKWSDKNTQIMASKMWQYAITMANSTRMRLYDVGYKEPDTGVLLGMIRGVGKFIISNNYSNCFDDALGQVMRDFRDRGKQEEYYACAEITPKLDFLPDVIDKMERQITKRLVERIDWDNRTLHIKNALIEDLNNIPMLERSILGAALGQGRAFSIFDMMEKSNVFVREHIPYWMANFQMNLDIIKSLRKRNPGKFEFNNQ